MFSLKYANLSLSKFPLTVTVRNASTKTMFTKNRQSKTLHKLIGTKEKSKHKWYGGADREGGPKFASATNFSNTNKEGKSSSHRVNVLNKLFMKHITDLLASGDIGSQIMGYGLQVSHVKLTNDFKYVNVFWLAKGDENDAKIEQILQQNSKIIRHDLSQLRLMGEVPKINFVKDLKYAKIAEVDRLLEQADFGDDYEIKSLGQQIINDFASDGSDTTSFKQNKDGSLVLPDMRYDVLGLDHPAIMNKIKQSMLKNKKAWEKYETIPTQQRADGVAASPAILEVVNQEIARSKREEFLKFLEHRKLQQKSRKANRDPNDKNSNFDDYSPADNDGGGSIEQFKYEEDDFVIEDDFENSKR